MPLEQRDKELAAIGASIGSNCLPCIEHHLRAGREAGLSQDELEAAVAWGHAVRDEAVALFASRVDELLGQGARSAASTSVAQASRTHELVALGVSVGANSHPLLRAYIAAARKAGLEAHQIKSALKMAGYVQQHAAALTAEAVTRALTDEGVASHAAAPG